MSTIAARYPWKCLVPCRTSDSLAMTSGHRNFNRAKSSPKLFCTVSMECGVVVVGMVGMVGDGWWLVDVGGVGWDFGGKMYGKM